MSSREQESKGVNRPNYDAILFFMFRYKKMYAAILVVTLAISFLEGASVAAFFPLFSTMFDDSSENAGGFAGTAVKVVRFLPMFSPFVAASLILISVFLVKTVGILMRDLLVAYASAKILYSVRKQVMERFSASEYQFIVDSQQGALVYNSMITPSSVSSLQMTLSTMLTSLMKVTSIMVVLLLLLPFAALAFIGLGLVYYFIIHYISRKVSYRLGQGRVKASSDLLIIANEFLNGFRQIISYATGKHWMAGFDQANRTHAELSYKESMWKAVPRPILELSAMGLLLGIVIFLKTTNPSSFTADLAVLGVFSVALVQILPALNMFGGTRLMLMNALPNVEIVHQVLTQSVPVRHDGHRTITSFKDAIVFEDMSFTHKSREALLDKVNIRIEKGEVTAIVGPSGSGKTTIINLILGLFDPSSGRITVDDVPIQDLTSESWLGRIGFVSQDPFIYNTTIGENIRFSRSGYSQEEVIQAATSANAHNFISELPEGYDTIVGDRGIKLSGGQQQRICIARAVLASPEILIFDEATSSLDALSEQQVQQAIDNASVHRTAIVIAHRLSTIRNAHKIIVLDDGKIVEQGTHQELLSRQGHYSHQVAAST